MQQYRKQINMFIYWTFGLLVMYIFKEVSFHVVIQVKLLDQILQQKYSKQGEHMSSIRQVSTSQLLNKPQQLSNKIIKQRFLNRSSLNKKEKSPLTSRKLEQKPKEQKIVFDKNVLKMSLKLKDLRSKSTINNDKQSYTNRLNISSTFRKNEEQDLNKRIHTERKDIKNNKDQFTIQKFQDIQRGEKSYRQIQKYYLKRKARCSIQHQTYKSLSTQKKRGISIQKLKETVNSYMKLMNQFQSKVSSITSSTSLSQSICNLDQSPKKICSFATSIKVKRAISFLEPNTKKTLITDFVILKKIGAGSYGSISLALHKYTNYLVALKKLSKKTLLKQNMAKIQTFLEHPNTVKLYGVFDDAQYIYFIMEFMEEGSLFEKMTKRNYNKINVSLFSEKVISNLMEQILEGINYLHKHRIMHRDIKPENIVMSYGVSKLCDFGWCALIGSSHQRRNTSCGTFDYIPPQIIKGQQYQDSVDMWQLGVTAYELIVGKLPFYHKLRKQTCLAIVNYRNNLFFPNSLPNVVKNFIMCLLQQKPQKRLSSEFMLQHPFIKYYSNKQ